jgi:hypothetical protein
VWDGGRGEREAYMVLELLGRFGSDLGISAWFGGGMRLGGGAKCAKDEKERRRKEEGYELVFELREQFVENCIAPTLIAVSIAALLQLIGHLAPLFLSLGPSPSLEPPLFLSFYRSLSSTGQW